MGWKYETNFTRRRSVTDPRKYIREREREEREEWEEEECAGTEFMLCATSLQGREVAGLWEDTAHAGTWSPWPTAPNPIYFYKKILYLIRLVLKNKGELNAMQT